jgi:hypothetical protein
MAVAAVLFVPSRAVSAGPFGAGIVLIVTQDYEPGVYPSRVIEMTRGGSIVQSIPFPRPGDDEARDLVVDRHGSLQVFNGTFDPYLSTYDPAGVWTHHTYAGWSIINNGTYGGIATFGDYVFVTDQRTFGPGDEPSGIVRFSLGDYSAARFASGGDYIDLTLGLDGLLYALYPSGSPGGTMVDVFDPPSLARIRTVSLPFGLSPRGLAVDATGRIFAAGFEKISRFSPTGALERTVTTSALVGSFHDLGDIDIDASGRLVMGGWCGEVLLSNGDLEPASSSLIQLPYCFEVFVTWVPDVSTSTWRSASWGQLKVRYR